MRAPGVGLGLRGALGVGLRGEAQLARLVLEGTPPALALLLRAPRLRRQPVQPPLRRVRLAPQCVDVRGQLAALVRAQRLELPQAVLFGRRRLAGAPCPAVRLDRLPARPAATRKGRK